jgi:hypothetical protein
MGISKTPPISSYPVWGVNEGSNSVSRYAPLPTPAVMRRRSLFGLKLQSSLTNETVPDETLQDYINQAISELEMSLDIYITPVTFEEKHDYLRDMFSFSYAYLKLLHPNVISVESVQISFNNDTLQNAAITFPLEHVHLMPQEAAIQLVPAFGTSLSGFLMSAFSGVQYHAFNSALLSNWPGAIRIKYTAGFEEGKIPAILTGLVEKMAAIRFLSAMGPILYPVSSTSIGIDGVSQSVGTPGPAYLSQRMNELEKQVQAELDTAKGYFQRRILIDFM